MARFIFVTGGVVSSLGKGLLSASLGALLQARGYHGPNPQVRPLSQRRSGDDVALPARRGLRHRRRRRERPRPRPLRALHRRFGAPVGQCHHRPHLPRHHRPRAARRLSRRDRPGHPARHQRDQGIRAQTDTDDVDFVICEIGGTVGDIESLPFVEAIRQLRNDIGRGQRRASSTPRWCRGSRRPAS